MYEDLAKSALWIAIVGACCLFNKMPASFFIIFRTKNLTSLTTLTCVSILLVYGHLSLQRFCLWLHRNKRGDEEFTFDVNLVIDNFLEELTFRAPLISVFMNFGTTGVAIAIPILSLLWGISHFANDDEHFEGRAIRFRIENMLWGVGAGILTILTGGITVPIILHLILNYFYSRTWQRLESTAMSAN